MKVLVLGGTGSIGMHLTEKLAYSGCQVFVSSRINRNDKQNLSFVKGNAKDMVFLSSLLCRQWDAIVDFMNYSTEEFEERVNAILNHTKIYYFFSSSRVYSNTNQSAITEESPLLINTSQDEEFLASKEYALSKAKEEMILASTGQRNWVIFRPYIIYSETRLQLGAFEKEDWLYRVLNDRSIIFQKSLLDKQTTLTYSPDAAEVLSEIILHKVSNGNIYNIVGGKKCRATWGEVLGIYQQVLQKLLNRTIPISYLNDQQVYKLRSGNSYYQISHDRMFHRLFDNGKIAKYKAEDSYKSIQEGIEICLRHFLESPHFSYTNQAQEAVLDRMTGYCSNVWKIEGVKQKLIYTYYRFIKH